MTDASLALVLPLMIGVEPFAYASSAESDCSASSSVSMSYEDISSGSVANNLDIREDDDDDDDEVVVEKDNDDTDDTRVDGVTALLFLKFPTPNADCGWLNVPMTLILLMLEEDEPAIVLPTTI